jgi:phosphoenolpyruvate phosphomutase
MNKFSALKDVVTSRKISFLMEAHNAISARIAQDSGFSAVWASGLTISASMGLSDRNEASWTQVLDIVECMADSVDVPVLMDGDTGFGNFNNVRRLVRKMGQKGIAGVCLEDKLFPKLNSFLGEQQDLISIDEFCGKLKAAKDSQTDNDFVVVARIEALISGLGMPEALRRADAYQAAGADAILIHSKQNNADQIVEFAREWGNRCPVCIVPTKYYKTPVDVFEQFGISVVIWANHNLRASIVAMKNVTKRIMRERSVMSIESEISTLDEIFALTNELEVQDAERIYLQPVAVNASE